MFKFYKFKVMLGLSIYRIYFLFFTVGNKVHKHLLVMPVLRTVKNIVKNHTDAEVKVREATSNDPWGPSSTLMAEIADLTYNVVAFTEIMGMIWKRLNDHGKNWRHVYKSLALLEYIIKTGSEKVCLFNVNQFYLFE